MELGWRWVVGILETRSAALELSRSWILRYVRMNAVRTCPAGDHSVQSPVNFLQLSICNPTNFTAHSAHYFDDPCKRVSEIFSITSDRSGENRLDENASLTKNNEFRDSSSLGATASPAYRETRRRRGDQTFARLKTWWRL